MTKARTAAKPRWDGISREIGIVTIGVLIALAIGEIADTIRWSLRVRNSMATVRLDLADARYTLIERKILQPCVMKQLDAISVALKQARKSGRLPEIKGLSFFPMRKFEFATWEVAKSEGITLHMSHAEAVALGHIYSGLENYPGVASGQEMIPWFQLIILAESPGLIDNGLVSSLDLLQHQARGQAILSGAVAEEQEGAIRRFGVPVAWSPSIPPGRRNAAGVGEVLRSWGYCGPVTIDGKQV